MRAQIRDKEIQARMFLYHRFGLVCKNTYIGDEEISIENLDFTNAVNELKRSYKLFIESVDNIDKINYLMMQAFASKHLRINEKESIALIHKISVALNNFHSEHYYDNLSEQLSKQSLIVIPLKTDTIENPRANHNNSNNPSSDQIHDHIKAIALFDERLLKINRRAIYKHPSVRVYRIQPYPFADMEALLQTFLNSFEAPLDHNNWDKTLNALSHAEKINAITKKEQNVGNGSWLTTKMILLAIVYAIIYQFCRSKEIKEFEAEPLTSQIAEGFYKLFIVDDRNRAIQEYLELHGFQKPLHSNESPSVTHRLASIHEFLSIPQDKKALSDKAMLEAIYIKSLNWLLADHLKKGDIGAAHALIDTESNNKHWNPLIYAAKNGKIVIAELLGSHAKYVNQKDSLGNTPLHYAIVNGHEDICRVLIRYRNKNKLNLLSTDNEGNTPLHVAALHNRIDILELLLATEPALLNMKNQNGETALKIACDHYHTNMIRKLLYKGASLEGIEIGMYSEEIQKQLSQIGRPHLQ